MPRTNYRRVLEILHAEWWGGKLEGVSYQQVLTVLIVHHFK